jgi:hypothetical protein
MSKGVLRALIFWAIVSLKLPIKRCKYFLLNPEHSNEADYVFRNPTLNGEFLHASIILEIPNLFWYKVDSDELLHPLHHASYM